MKYGRSFSCGPKCGKNGIEFGWCFEASQIPAVLYAIQAAIPGLPDRFMGGCSQGVITYIERAYLFIDFIQSQE
tara:strand:- start:379 stop:600 length:222 start_codon:yes stop_codon:yes gene_type:complete